MKKKLRTNTFRRLFCLALMLGLMLWVSSTALAGDFIVSEDLHPNKIIKEGDEIGFRYVSNEDRVHGHFYYYCPFDLNVYLDGQNVKSVHTDRIYDQSIKPSNRYVATKKCIVHSYTGTDNGDNGVTHTLHLKSLEISDASITITNNTFTYDGNPHFPTVTVKNASGDTLTQGTDYTLSSSETNAETYSVTVTGAGNYTGSQTVPNAWTINRASINNPSVNINGWTYGDNANSPSLGTDSNPGGGGVTYQYTNRNGTASYNSNTAPTNAGEYTVTATIGQTQNYNSGTASKDFTISRQDITPVFVENGTGNNVEFIPSGQIPNGITPIIRLRNKQGNIVPDTEYQLAVIEKNHQVNISDDSPDGGNYNITTATLNYPFQIGTANVSVVPEAADLTYTGVAQKLLATTGEAKQGRSDAQMAYALGDSNGLSAPTDKSAWKTSIDDITATTAGDYYVWYRALGDKKDENDEDYEYNDSTPVKIRVTIEKAPLTIKANDKEITYGDAPANDGVKYEGFQNDETENTLGVLEGSLEYQYTYSQGGDVEAATGQDSGQYQIIPSGLTADNYDIKFVRGKLTVNKKPVTIIATAENKVYDGIKEATIVDKTVKESDLCFGDKLNVDGGTAEFSDAAIGDNKTVTFTGFVLTGDRAGNYKIDTENPITSKANITVKDASSVTATATPDTLTYTGSENKPILEVKDGTLELAEGTDFEVAYEGTGYERRETAPTNVGTYQAVLTFKGNYDGEKKVSFNIVPKSITGATVKLDNTELPYTGSDQTVSITEVKVDNLTLTKDTDYTTEPTEPFSGTDMQEYTITLKGKGNFKDSVTATWKIGKATPVINPAPTAASIEQGKKLSDSELTGGVAKLGETIVEGKFAWKNPNDTPAVTDADGEEFEVVFRPNDTTHYNEAEVKVNLIVRPQAGQNPVGRTGLVYNDQEQNLVASGYTGFEYAIGSDATNVPTGEWSRTVPKGTNAGTYYVWYKLENDTETEPAKLDVTIAQKSIQETDVTLNPTELTYNGEDQTVPVDVKDGDKPLTENTDYTVTGNVQMNAGHHTVTITGTVEGTGNYTGTVTKTFTIKPFEVTQENVNITDIPTQIVTDNQSTATPTVQFTITDANLKSQPVLNTDYTIAYETVEAIGADNVGKSKAVVTFNGNFIGSFEVPYYVVKKPNTPTEDELKAAGYQIADEVVTLPNTEIYEVSTDGAFNPPLLDGSTLKLGDTIYVRVKSQTVNKDGDQVIVPASEPLTITLRGKQKAPIGVTGTDCQKHGTSDGQLNNVEAGMEYRQVTDSSGQAAADQNWKTIDNDVVSNLPAGAYEVRYAQKANESGVYAEASEAVIVNIFEPNEDGSTPSKADVHVVMPTFGEIPSGQTVTRDVVVYNAGNAEATITAVSLANGNFTMTPNAQGQTLAPGANLIITLQPNQTAVGNYDDTLSVSYQFGGYTLSTEGSSSYTITKSEDKPNPNPNPNPNPDSGSGSGSTPAPSPTEEKPNFNDETLPTKPGDSYSTDDGTTWKQTDKDNMPLEDTGWDGEKPITVIVKDSTGKQTIYNVPARPDAPTDLTAEDVSETGKKDGKILGANDTMEYSVDGGKTWQKVTGDTIDGLGEGDVLVRYAATDNTFASKPATLTIKAKSGKEEPSEKSLYFAAHVEDLGWDKKNTELAPGGTAAVGTTGQGKRVEAVAVMVPEDYKVVGFAHVQNEGDVAIKKVETSTDYTIPEGYTAYEFGSVGKGQRVEAVCIGIQDANGEYVKGFQYATHLQNFSWQGFVRNGSFAGSRAMSLRMESIRFAYAHPDVVTPEGPQVKAETQATDESPAKAADAKASSIYMTAHVQNLAWDKNLTELKPGESVLMGTTGRGLRIEAVTFVVPKDYTVSGFAHVQNEGDVAIKKIDNPEYVQEMPEGYVAYEFGSTGKSQRVEAVCVDIQDAAGEHLKGFQYAAYLQNFAWQGYVRNGSFAGSRGMSLRMEAIRFAYVDDDIVKIGEPKK